MPKQYYSSKFKLAVLLAYENKNYTMKEICSKFHIAKCSLKEWIKQYEKYELDGLKNSNSFKQYPKEMKEAAVRDYLSGEFSITTTSAVRSWGKRKLAPLRKNGEGYFF